VSGTTAEGTCEKSIGISHRELDPSYTFGMSMRSSGTGLV